jgi:hypothetical protein
MGRDRERGCKRKRERDIERKRDRAQKEGMGREREGGIERAHVVKKKKRKVWGAMQRPSTSVLQINQRIHFSTDTGTTHSVKQENFHRENLLTHKVTHCVMFLLQSLHT